MTQEGRQQYLKEHLGTFYYPLGSLSMDLKAEERVMNG
jgi:hypothetical protein